MKFSKVDYTNIHLKEYCIYGSKIPTEALPSPTIYKSNLFARNSVIAKSLFAKLMNKQYKLKASQMVVLKCEEVEQDKDFKVKNYRIDFVYRTRTGMHNAYKEIRHINKVNAVSTMHQEFGSRHKLKASDMSIISVKEITAEEATKPKCLTYSAEGVKYPLFKKIPNSKKHFVPVTEEIFN